MTFNLYYDQTTFHINCLWGGPNIDIKGFLVHDLDKNHPSQNSLPDGQNDSCEIDAWLHFGVHVGKHNCTEFLSQRAGAMASEFPMGFEA